MKLFFTYSEQKKEGFESRVPLTTSNITDASVDEITVEGVLERVPNLIQFIEECYRIIKPNGTVTLSAKFYGSSGAWSSPFAIRGISEQSLNFASKDWRAQTQFTEATVLCNFSVAGNVGISPEYELRSDVAKNFMVKHYNNFAQVVLFTLIKLEP